MPFVPDVPANAGEPERLRGDLRRALGEAGVDAPQGPSGAIHVEFTPGSYEPIPVTIALGEGTAIVTLEGELTTFEEEPTDELRLALNHLNLESGVYRFYVTELGRGYTVCARCDLFPDTAGQPFHPRELKQALSGLCAQKAMFEESLTAIQEGRRPWRQIKDAVRALR